MAKNTEPPLRTGRGAPRHFDEEPPEHRLIIDTDYKGEARHAIEALRTRAEQLEDISRDHEMRVAEIDSAVVDLNLMADKLEAALNAAEGGEKPSAVRANISPAPTQNTGEVPIDSDSVPDRWNVIPPEPGYEDNITLAYPDGTTKPSATISLRASNAPDNAKAFDYAVEVRDTDAKQDSDDVLVHSQAVWETFDELDAAVERLYELAEEYPIAVAGGVTTV